MFFKNLLQRFFICGVLLSGVMLSLAACGGEDEPEAPQTNITVSPESVNFKAESSSATVKLSTNHEWSAYSEEEWIHVSPESSVDHNATITISVDKNFVAEKREGSVNIMSGTARASIKVVQEAGDGSEDPNVIKCPLDGYKLVWNDEFDKGNTLSSDWVHEVKSDHWVNNELQNYVNHEIDGKPVTTVSNGTLKINCFKNNGKVYSGRVYAKKSTGWKYAYVEAKIKLPSGKGTWPAFWMMPVNFTSWPHDGEIDIMEEVGYHKDYVSSSLHADGHVHSNGTQVTKEVYCKGAEGDFHVYGMEWTGSYFQFYVDGAKTLYYKNPGTGVRDWPYDAPFYVILNLAWGGDWGGSQGVDESALPATMEVDYVRVFQK